MKGGVDSEDVGGVPLEACNWRLVNWSTGQWDKVIVRYQTELCALPLRPREEPNIDALVAGFGVSGKVA